MSAPALSPFDAAAVLLVAAAVLGYINRRFLPFSASVGLTFMGAIASLIVVGVDAALPGAHLSAALAAFLKTIDFSSTLLNGMLCFLLFAGALHIDWRHMRPRAGRSWPYRSLAPWRPRAWWLSASWNCHLSRD